MSIVTLFTRQAPTIAGIEFDAVLEDELESSVEITGYPIESGVRVADHRIRLPFRYRLVGAVSNNPLRVGATDFLNAALSELGGIASQVGGFAASFLAGSDATRGSSALNLLISLQTTGDPFDIDTGEVQLSNMVIVDLRRSKDPSTEGGMIFEATMQEMPTLDTLLADGQQPNQDQLRDGDQAQTQAAADVNLGQQIPTDAGSVDVSGVIG